MKIIPLPFFKWCKCDVCKVVKPTVIYLLDLDRWLCSDCIEEATELIGMCAK